MYQENITALKKDAPIGVFDSGIGGLTVAREIMRQIPNEKIIYFGDTARMPYGSKSKETVTGFSKQIVRFLETFQVKTKDVKQIAQADVALHDIIVEATGNQRLIQLVNNLSEQMYRYRFEYIKDSSQHERLVEEHKVIYESIVKKDKETASHMAKVHIDNQKKAIIRQIRLEREKNK